MSTAIIRREIWGGRHDGTKTPGTRNWPTRACRSPASAPIPTANCSSRTTPGGRLHSGATPKEEPPAPFPTQLSETGFFTSVKGHQWTPALIPYDVNAALWSDGAYKERWIALPGDGQIDFTAQRGWNFPEGTVLVKSFALELAEGDPASRGASRRGC